MSGPGHATTSNHSFGFFFSDDYSVLSRCQDQPLHPCEWSSFQDRTRGGTCRFRRHYPVKDSFINKRALLSTRIASTIPPLNLALMNLMEQAALAYSDCDKYLGLLEDVTTLPADARQPAIEKLDAAKAQADQARLSHAKVLPILSEALKSTAWPRDDAALEFRPKSQGEASPAIVEGHRASAQRNASMSSIKRTHEQSKEVDDTAAEEDLVLKKRKLEQLRKSGETKERGYESEEPE